VPAARVSSDNKARKNLLQDGLTRPLHLKPFDKNGHRWQHSFK
jgi:hypothetical protein